MDSEMNLGGRYAVETLDQNEYPEDELTMYLNEVSRTNGLRLVSAYPTSSGMLTLIWELEDYDEPAEVEEDVFGDFYEDDEEDSEEDEDAGEDDK
ncbi:MAG: hypothetical protein K6G50_06105 [bacterium]|nr:hypothetical protein [bacterium]